MTGPGGRKRPGTGRRPPLRLLLVTHSLSGGGAERFVATLAGALDRARFAPAVGAATGRLTYPVPEDVTVVELGYGGLVTLPRTIRRLRRLILRTAPDVVLSNVLSTNCLTGSALPGPSDSLPAPAWVARIGNDPERGDPVLQRLWARRLYRRADLVVANSRGLEAAATRSYPAIAARTRAIPNPVDFERIERLAQERPAGGNAADRRDSVRVLWMGRMTRQKRPDLALEALALARLRGAAVRLQMCGEGPLRSAVERRIHRLGLESAVELSGFVDAPFAAMRAADLYLATSDFEGLPNALIESQGLGVPAVATRCPHGPDEIVDDGETGILTPVGDAEALAGAVTELARDPGLRARLGSAAARRARQRFGLERVIPRWEEALEGVAVLRRDPTARREAP